MRVWLEDPPTPSVPVQAAFTFCAEPFITTVIGGSCFAARGIVDTDSTRKIRIHFFTMDFLAPQHRRAFFARPVACIRVDVGSLWVDWCDTDDRSTLPLHRSEVLRF
jgi:hypothetical protein